MKIFAIGSCRTCNCFKSGEYPTDYMHTTKEILQLFDLVRNPNIEYKDMYRLINRSFTNSKRIISEINRIKNKLLTADIIILEISSIKTAYYSADNLYFNIDLYNCVIKKSENVRNNQQSLVKLYDQSENIQANTKIDPQTESQLKEDLDQIYMYLVCELNKKIVLIPHINATIVKNNIHCKIPSREMLCKVLSDFSSNEHIRYFNPMDYLDDDYSKIFDNGNNGHYSKSSAEIIKHNLHTFIAAIL